MAVILVGGGSRSGKSTYALQRARKAGQRLGFIATAEAHDEEMRLRIGRHRIDRPADFQTIEEPLELAEAIHNYNKNFDAIVVDCLTLWLSNLIMANVVDLEQRFDELARVSQAASADLILVTNEVGCGIVPDTELGRVFRDAAGRLNQSIASVADEVYWTVFGNPLRIK